MRIVFQVEVEINHVSGKFVSRDDISPEIEAALNDANESTIYVEDSEYEIADWAVSEVRK